MELSPSAFKVLTWSALQEFPAIRFRIRGTEAIDGRDLAAKRLACKVHERLQGLQRLRALPDTETCDFIVLDRCGLEGPVSCSGFASTL